MVEECQIDGGSGLYGTSSVIGGVGFAPRIKECGCVGIDGRVRCEQRVHSIANDRKLKDGVT